MSFCSVILCECPSNIKVISWSKITAGAPVKQVISSQGKTEEEVKRGFLEAELKTLIFITMANPTFKGG